MPLLFPHDPAIASIGAADHLWRAQPFLATCRMVLERDEHRCINCEISIPGWMEIHHRDHDHDNFSRENLATICHFCHLLYHPLQAGHHDHEPPLVLLRWPDADQVIIQNLAWLLLYFQHGEILTEYDEVDTEKALLHKLAYPTIENHIQSLHKEIELRQSKAGSWGVVGLDSMLEYAVSEGEPASWSELRFFPAGLVMPKRQLGLMSLATPTMVRLPFLQPEEPTDTAGLFGNPLLLLLQPDDSLDQHILANGQERLARYPTSEETP